MLGARNGWVTYPRHDGHLKRVRNKSIMSNRDGLFQGTNVSVSKPRKHYGRYLWPTSGTRREDQELEWEISRH